MNNRSREEPFVGPTAWTASTLEEGAWRLPLPDSCRGEMLRCVEGMRRYRLPLLRRPEHFELPQTRILVEKMRRILESGTMHESRFKPPPPTPNCGANTGWSPVRSSSSTTSTGHARTFEDSEDPQLRRLLVRLWVRDTGCAYFDAALEEQPVPV